jgi:hypothetical protein
MDKLPDHRPLFDPTRVAWGGWGLSAAGLLLAGYGAGRTAAAVAGRGAFTPLVLLALLVGVLVGFAGFLLISASGGGE